MPRRLIIIFAFTLASLGYPGSAHASESPATITSLFQRGASYEWVKPCSITRPGFGFGITWEAPAGSGQPTKIHAEIGISKAGKNLGSFTLSEWYSSTTKTGGKTQFNLLACKQLKKAMKSFGIGSKATSYTATVLSASAIVDGSKVAIAGNPHTKFTVKRYARFGVPKLHKSKASATVTSTAFVWGRSSGKYKWRPAPAGTKIHAQSVPGPCNVGHSSIVKTREGGKFTINWPKGDRGLLLSASTKTISFSREGFALKRGKFARADRVTGGAC